MPLGLYPRETAEALQTGVGDEDTTAPPKPSFFQGAAKATALGVGEGAIKVGSLVGDTNLGGALAPMGVDYQQPVEESTPEEHQQNIDQTTARAVAAFAPDPHTTGAAGEILHGVASGLTRFVAGAEMAGGSPVGGAVGVGLTEGETQAAQLRAQGVDADTAKLAGIGQGLMAGAGSMLPGGVGSKLAARVVTGAAMQTTAGMLNRGMMHGVLADAGYDQMAEAYKPLDGMAMLTDAVLGSAFGAAHHAFAPSVVDAAHTAADSVHVEDAAPGAPVTPESRQAHVDNMSSAAEALIAGTDMPELRPVETIPNPAQDAIRATNADAVTEAADEAIEEAVGRSPLTIDAYHGTTSDFTGDFGAGDGIGPHFGTLEQASAFARGEGGNIRPVTLSFNNLLRLPDGMWENGSGMAMKLHDAGLLSEDEMQNIAPLRGRAATDEENAADLTRAREHILSKGYDGIVYDNHMANEGKGDSYIALKPKQQVQGKFMRRADEIDDARIQELRGKLRDGSLSDAEKDELIGLQEKDRLSAKVGGRRIDGVQTDEAYEEMKARGEALPVQGFIDMDMLKSVNDTLGHPTGDSAIRTLGQVLAHYFGKGNVFRRSSSGAGDEFIVQSKDQATHDAAIAAARQHLDAHTLRALDSEGNVIGEKKGIGFSHGSGHDIKSAEAAQYAEKAERARQGLRSEREPDGGAVDAEPATPRGESDSGEAAGSEATDRIGDPATQEAVDAATPLLDAHPDLTVTDENGTELPAREAMQRALDDLRNAVGDDELHKVAAACFGRLG